MATGRSAGDSTRHADIQADGIRMQYAVDRAQQLEGAVSDRGLSGLGRDANAHRAFAVQLPMRAAADLPEAVDAACHDVVVRPAQRTIRAKADEGGQHQRRRIAGAGVKAHSQQGTLMELFRMK